LQYLFDISGVLNLLEHHFVSHQSGFTQRHSLLSGLDVDIFVEAYFLATLSESKLKFFMPTIVIVILGGILIVK
jgi:hypothetical protein